MSTLTTRPRRLRRLVATLTAVGVAAAGLTLQSGAPAAAAETDVSDATLTWGLSGYAQAGIMGPWNVKDLTGDVQLLDGSVSGGDQSTYVVDPIPATSMPASDPQDTPNAVHFTDGTGTTDPETAATEVSWSGSYTVNAYPAQFNAPNEIYSDPVLSLDASGDGELTMDFTLGAGQDMMGNPTPRQELGRLTILSFSAGSVVGTGDESFRATPDYQGVEVEIPEGEGSQQTRTCTTDGDATGWWGSWPADFVNSIPSSVRPHFYSTGCGGMQDRKPPLPIDVTVPAAPAPEPTQASVRVSDTTILPSGAYRVTVRGSGFTPGLAVGTRPPLAGEPAGAYVVFGKFASTWQPSQGAGGDSRPVASQQWAVPTTSSAVEGTIPMQPDGTFTARLTIDRSAADAAAGGAGRYGIYTYAASGAVEPTYETATPIRFVKATTRTKVKVRKPRTRRKGKIKVRVVGGPTPEGRVKVLYMSGRGKFKRLKRLNDSGVVRMKLPRSRQGKRKLVVTYLGDVNHKKSRKVKRFRVRR